MIRTFIELPFFTKKWMEIGLDDIELLRLQVMLLDNPQAGPIIEGTGGIRKIRFPLRNRGKSGSIRVCYVDFEEYDIIYLLTVYTKKEKDNLSNEEKNYLKKLVKMLKEEALHRRKKQ